MQRSSFNFQGDAFKKTGSVKEKELQARCLKLLKELFLILIRAICEIVALVQRDIKSIELASAFTFIYLLLILGR